MALKLNYDILRIIFKYLNGLDLSNVSQVSRSWLESANDEKKTRGPMCIARTYSNFNSKEYKALQKEIKECCIVKPSFSMLFINVNIDNKIKKECCRKHLSFDWYSPVIGSFLPNRKKNTFLGMFFPEETNIKVNTLTFVPFKHIYGNEIYCHETKTKFNISFKNAEQLKTVFESVYSLDVSMRSFMILLCDRNGVLITTNLENALRNWFPNKRLPVWGGIVDYLSIYNPMPLISTLKNSMQCIAILISGKEMHTWSTFLYCTCNNQKKIEKKLKHFKNNIVLKKHSIGFMFTSQSRNRFFFLESTIFKQIFPNVPLVEHSGFGAFGGSDKEPYTRILNNLNIFDKTAIMVITYE
ncbi:hypothetical protein M0802_012618 [Mischocyttarus mexicanus]|nr:hypothetical protein M0802_012618 [Mischocyttarus mexicanus]